MTKPRMSRKVISNSRFPGVIFFFCRHLFVCLRVFWLALVVVVGFFFFVSLFFVGFLFVRDSCSVFLVLVGVFVCVGLLFYFFLSLGSIGSIIYWLRLQVLFQRVKLVSLV